ncbi:MAG: S-methyl-5-thioribose-1-phosphate isomerase [Spirochaetales bacterium]|nr:S-methyl-5-thioribose-1-phosphate isomerase [Spirochaetales bacterium]
MLVNGKHYRTVWMEKGIVKLINQPLLPHKFEIYECRNHTDTAKAISTMVVRGAGAIGSAGGFGMAQAVLESASDKYVEKARERLKNTRPTAQNLFYSIDRVYSAFLNEANKSSVGIRAFEEANTIADEDAAACRKIAEIGSSLIEHKARILTHCNAGWLAFTDWGSALSPVFYAKREGKDPFVWVDETRPRLQGARLTAWELKEENIRYAIIADNAAGYFISRGEVDLIIVGSDRIARNGDVANKIGTYEKAVLAYENGIPFYVSAPTATIDWTCNEGRDIPIEERSEEEVLYVRGRDNSGKISAVQIAPNGSTACNPAFDVTPAKYITGIITERGLLKPEELGRILPDKI